MTTTTTGGERRTGAQTRAEILRVALELFTEKGFEGTSTRDISGALGITKSALYYHFENKGAIAASLVEERKGELDDFIDWVTAQPASPDLLQRAALRWVEGTTPECLTVDVLGSGRVRGGNYRRAIPEPPGHSRKPIPTACLERTPPRLRPVEDAPANAVLRSRRQRA